ncbi:MAG: hypothetical protein GY941_20020, partial [Planctomycetes bacterium]|nr:hypothetical protein [Planctomycetota bacterium]
EKMNIQEFIKRITGISTPFGGISWEGTKQKSDVEVAIDEFVKEWEKNGFGNPANVNLLIGPEEHNLMKLTSQIYAKNLISGELDKTKHMPDISWNEEQATNICYAQKT